MLFHSLWGVDTLEWPFSGSGETAEPEEGWKYICGAVRSGEVRERDCAQGDEWDEADREEDCSGLRSRGVIGGARLPMEVLTVGRAVGEREVCALSSPNPLTGEDESSMGIC